MTGENNPANFWSFNPFVPPSGSAFTPGASPAPRPHVPKPVPDIEELYTVQKDLVNAINAYHDNDHDHMHHQLENGYRVLVRYLNKWGTMR